MKKIFLFLTILLIIPSFASASLIGYWDFDENSGNTAVDSSGYNHNGTLCYAKGTGSSYYCFEVCNGKPFCPEWVDGKFGSGLQFNGENITDEGGMLDFGGSSFFDFDSDVFSVSFWFKTRGTQAEADFMGKMGNINGWTVGMVQSKAFCQAEDGNSAPDSFPPDGAVIADGQWHHMVFISSGSGSTIYVDNTTHDNMGSHEGVSNSDNLTMAINGMRQEFYNGTFDEVKVFNHSLSSSEISDLFGYDPVSPTWSGNATYPVSGEVETTNQQFNTTWDDNVAIDTVLYEHNFSGSLANYTSTGNEGTEYYYNYNVTEGTYVWKSYANDTSNNWNETDTWEYVVEPAPPSPPTPVTDTLTDVGQGVGNLLSGMGAPLVILFILLSIGSMVGFFMGSVGRSIGRKI